MVVLIECVILCALFTLAVVTVSLKDPLAGVHNWPPAIQQRARELGLIREKQMAGSKAVYLIWTVINWYDAIVIDCFWICHDKRMRIPGTENMKEYQDYWFHVKGSLKGQIIGLPICLFVGGLTAVLVSLCG